MRTIIVLAALLAGCFQSYDEVQASCMETFPPSQSPELFQNCVDGRMHDIQVRRQAAGEAWHRAFNPPPTPATHCTSTAVGNSVTTDCQ